MPRPFSEKSLEQFLSDLHQTLAKGRGALLEEALNRYWKLLESGESAAWSRVASQIADAIDCTENAALGALRFLTNLAVWIASDEDEGKPPGTAFEQIRDAAAETEYALTPEGEQRFRELVDRLAQTSQSTRHANLRGLAARGVLPAFQSLAATLELRSTWLLPGQFEEGSTASQLELIPVASIRLDLDSGEPDFICFQATEEHLSSLQEQILQLLEGLRRLKERVKVTPR